MKLTDTMNERFFMTGSTIAGVFMIVITSHYKMVRFC